MSGFWDVFKKNKPIPGLPAPKETQLSPYQPSQPKKALIEYIFPKSVLPPKLMEQKKKSEPKPLTFLKEAFKPGELKKQASKGKETPPRYVFLEPSAPPEVYPPRARALPSASQAQKEWSLPSVEELADHLNRTLDLDAIFRDLKTIRSSPDFKKDQVRLAKQGLPMMIPVERIVYQESYTDFFSFYGIPWSVFESYTSWAKTPKEEIEADKNLWLQVIMPLNDLVTDAFEFLKPDKLPGFFVVETDDQLDFYYLYYVEPMLENLEGEEVEA